MSSRQSHPRRTPECHSARRITPPLAVSKGATFHSPKSPSVGDDPVLSVASLPQRTLTSPESLEAIVSGADSHILKVLDSIDKKLLGLRVDSSDDLHEKHAFPVPRFLIAHAASGSGSGSAQVAAALGNQQQDPVQKASKSEHHNSHDHASDSGLGTSISDDSNANPDPLRQCRFCDSSEPGHADLHEAQRAWRTSVHTPVRPQDRRRSNLQLSEYAQKKIKDLVVDPILAEQGLKEYHNLIKEIPQRIGDRAITCLRDLEKTLIYLAPYKAKSAAAYLNFAETSIQCIHTTVEHLNEREQRRPTDRPYTNNYFLDLVSQVRQYARIMAVSRQKQREGKSLSPEDWTPLVAYYYSSSDDVLISLCSGEKLRLKGGLAHSGEPAELVRDKPTGETVSIDAGKRKLSAEAFCEDAESSMARKRKCDIGKIDWRQCHTCKKWFKRPCDLTKHEKTHTRPWKCPEVGCKYHEAGWPTEKERDRHMNDKHNSQPVFYKCKFEGCSYTSKRESNCKQHMEKTHGYQYVRSKSRKGEHLTPVAAAAAAADAADKQAEASMPTPSSASAYQPLSTPSTTFNPSPITSSDNAFSPSGTAETNVSPSSNQDFSGLGSRDPNKMFEADPTLFHSGDSYFSATMESHPTNTALFNASPPVTDFSGDLTMGNSDPMINNNVGPTYDLTPPLTDFTGGRRTSDFSAIDDTIPNEAWTTEFEFGDGDMAWPAPTNFFPEYNTSPETFMEGFGEMGESSAMAQTLFADDLVRGAGLGGRH